jgi:glucose/arabinose dehydrogenase
MLLLTGAITQSGYFEISQAHRFLALINRIRLSGFALLLILLSTLSLNAATLPAGFAETQVAAGLSNPTAMAFAPDGRLFVCQQGGQLRVIKNGALLATPFLTVTTDPSGERGLLGIAFDPNFATNQFIYVYYTATTPATHNRVSRFTANGDVAVAGSEVVILDLNNLSGATNHNGGAMHFGADGKLYIAVGENATPSNSQTFSNLLGKILRINPDPNNLIPTDNPFFNTASGNNRAIWVLGLRNPYTFAFQPGTGRMFINDVGQNAVEEINDGIAGSNYGWPTCEGSCANVNFRNPLFQYGHAIGPTGGCAITGGAFYNPAVNQFPSQYVGKYFFADFCSGWIRLLDPSNNSSSDFASGIASPVDLKVGPDGNLYYLARGSGAIFRIRFTGGQAPSIGTQPISQTVAEGQPATFTVGASGTAPLSYQWQRNTVNIPNTNSPSYTLPSASLADNGAKFRVVVTNSFGSATSSEATLTVMANQPPVGNIATPVVGTLYSAGQTISYSGTGTDPETGNLPASAFTWQVDFHHDTHTHPFIPATTGVTSGSFTIPTTGETSANVWYRIHLTVRDSAGLTHTSFRDILPRKSTITLATNPAGLQLTLDGQPLTTPFAVESVVGIQRTLGVVSPQTVNGVVYQFTSWSDAGSASHTISTPASNTTYTANFTAQPQTLAFSAAGYSGGEGSGSINITVTRAGGTSGALTVDYIASGGTASERTDYTTLVGTLRFADGEQNKTLTLLLSEDGYAEGNETVNLILSNVQGGVLGVQSTSVVTIVDDDAAPSPSNPINQTPVFVRQHYHDFLNREPEPVGFQGWQDILTNCPPSGRDANGNFCDRIEVSSAFFRSLEFQQRGYFVYRFYSASFGRVPRYTEFMPDMARVSGFQSAQQEEASKVAFIDAFMARQEFKDRYDGITDPRAYVEALEMAAGVVLANREALISDLAAQGKSRAQVLRAVAESVEVFQKYYNQAFVVMQYFGYLRRDPDILYLEWIRIMNETGGDYRGMINGFINSNEYRSRFGQP